jgi:DNA-binding CsgD family transcriptional regulator
MTVTEPAPASTRQVRIDVTNLTVRLALCFVAEDAGFPRGSSSEAMTVSDTIPAGEFAVPIDVLVIDARPVACQRAIGAISQGSARSGICNDEPDRLPSALRAVNDHLSVMPRRVIECANRAPVLSSRQFRILQLIAAGASNQKIATTTYASLSTVKRDVAHLLELFDAPNRLALTAAAVRLGYQFS